MPKILILKVCRMDVSERLCRVTLYVHGFKNILNAEFVKVLNFKSGRKQATINNPIPKIFSVQ